jgi:hypothetical protein
VISYSFKGSEVVFFNGFKLCKWFERDSLIAFKKASFALIFSPFKGG